ncbi:hypothetical protein OCU04_010574 [Sclerotinia nivalis]|uniref:Uncharacterized protein n=1 Tax=Sclerotinia nivalis TaxID=352851 RepID=A0A9X0ACC6_9HELO|nr:hypothetical protein OCU04_010574 [Sclerotinia nivalis]
MNQQKLPYLQGQQDTTELKEHLRADSEGLHLMVISKGWDEGLFMNILWICDEILTLSATKGSLLLHNKSF